MVKITGDEPSVPRNLQVFNEVYREADRKYSLGDGAAPWKMEWPSDTETTNETTGADDA